MLPDGGPFLPRILRWMSAESPLEAKRLDDGITYIRISNFRDPVLSDRFLTLIDSLDKSEATKLLIDLRFCLGGRSDVAEKIVGALIDAPVSSPRWRYPHYVAAEQNWGQLPEWSTTSQIIPVRNGRTFMGPLVILTSGVTSSTAEDFAISLREAGRALLVGEKTAGSAGNPLSVPLPGGGQFEMATFRAYLPNDGEYVGIGLEPDVQVCPTKQDVRNGVDIVMEKGIGVLTNWQTYRK
jgi:C-terminal processing protease CtpA/Prc